MKTVTGTIFYAQVIHRLPMPHVGDELHHSGWNACSSCYDNPEKKRAYMVLPCLASDRVYIVNTAIDERAPRMHKVQLILIQSGSGEGAHGGYSSQKKFFVLLFI